MYEIHLPPISRDAMWSQWFEALDDETVEPIDVSDATITFEISERGRSILKATNANGGIKAEPGSSFFEVTILTGTLANVCVGTYRIGATIATGGKTYQILIGSVPIIDGGII